MMMPPSFTTAGVSELIPDDKSIGKLIDGPRYKFRSLHLADVN
jgi:hypothetical protein